MTEPACRAESDFDTVVIGGGVVGLCVTWFLAETGAAVLCIDDGREAGSTANAGSLHVQMQSRLIRLFPERLADYQKALPIYPRAVDYWAEIAKELDEDVELQIGGGLMIADSREQLVALEEKCRCERQSGLDTDIVGRQELLRLAPYLHAEALGAVHCAKEGKINPLLANAAIRNKVHNSGGVIRPHCRVERIEQASRGYLVTTGAETIRTDRVVIAAGAGTGKLAATLGLYLPTTAEPLHMNITDATDSFITHLLQHAERPITMKQMRSGQVLIGGGWPAGRGRQGGVPEVLRDSLIGNLRLAQEMVPRVGSLRVTRSWAGINPMVDLLSVLGEVDSMPGVFVAVPGDAGYTLGPYCARLLVDRMSGNSSDFPLTDFSPTRFAANDRPAPAI
jgi:glycine/D-amino acid oxidase-like deaminating enzyme